MKKQLISLLFLGLAFVAQAQTINVPYINIERYRNVSVEMVFMVKNNSAIQNLSSTELRFRVLNGANYAVDSSTRVLGGITNLDSAKIRVLINPTQVARLRGDVYNYEFLKVVGGTKTMLCTGQFRLILNPSASGAPPANIIVINTGTGTASSVPSVGGGIVTETDPTVGIHIKTISLFEKNSWNTAYNWGNHASMGYLTSAALQQGISNKMNYSDSTLFARKTILPFYLLKKDTTGKWKSASYVPTWSEILSKPTFSTVATSGSYTDLTNKPTIPTVPDTTVLLRKTTAAALYQPKGNYQPLGNYQKVQEVDQSDGIFTNMVIRNTTSGEILRLWIGGDTTDTGPNKFKMYVLKGTFSGVNDWRMFDVEGSRYEDENLYGVTQIDSSTTQVINSVTYRIYIQKFAISKISIGDLDSAGTGRRLIFNYPVNWVFVEQKRWKKAI